MMTNKEHDDLWMAAFSSIPNLRDIKQYLFQIDVSISRANEIEIAKELYSLGEMSREQYVKCLSAIGKAEGMSQYLK